MPRVTQSHRDRQAARILDAAAACFARRGFQATSMDEIIGAAGMSSSTVYRYFPKGKGSLIHAVLERATDPVLTWVVELAECPELPDAEAALLDGVRRTLALEGLTGDERGSRDRDEGAASASLIAYAWVEMSRDSRVREESARRYALVRSRIAALVVRWQAAGQITDRLEARAVAAVVHNVIMGLVVDRIVLGAAGGGEVDDVVRAVTALLAP